MICTATQSQWCFRNSMIQNVCRGLSCFWKITIFCHIFKTLHTVQLTKTKVKVWRSVKTPKLILTMCRMVFLYLFWQSFHIAMHQCCVSNGLAYPIWCKNESKLRANYETIEVFWIGSGSCAALGFWRSWGFVEWLVGQYWPLRHPPSSLLCFSVSPNSVIPSFE